MNGATRRSRLSTAALLAAAFGAAPAMGQVQAQDGAALDANQQVGSGGYNQPGQAIDYRARNLLITGEVGGGRAFQDTVGYSAIGSFQGTLGSDALYGFRRDSIYSAAGSAGLQAQNYGDRVIVTRATDNLSGYRVTGGNALSTYAGYDPGAGVLTFRQPGGGLVAVTGISDPTQVGTGSSLGLLDTPQGLVSIDASPLTGVRYNPLDVNTRSFNPALKPTEPDPSDAPTAPDLLDPRDVPADNSLNPNRTIDGQTGSPGETNEIGETRIDDLAGLGLPENPLTIELGNQVQSAIALQMAGRDDNNIPNSQALAIRDQLFGPNMGQKPGQVNQPGEPPKAPENPYDKLIADIIAQSQGEEVEQADAGDEEPAEDNRPRWQQILEEPEQGIIDARKKAREAAIRLSLGMVDANGEIDYSQPLPTIDADSELGRLLADLDYDLPAVRTLAGTDPNRINGLMTRGEQELKAGRYTMAEAVYRQILRETGDPLAKAGLIHAQMGAGMIRSAAYNLRGLFSDHPELIALRYDTTLLPETDRLRWLQGKLQTSINEEAKAADPGLVLAYLGYQLKAKPLIEYGLAVAEAEAPRDPLLPVLRRIWIEGKDAGAETGGE